MDLQIKASMTIKEVERHFLILNVKVQIGDKKAKLLDPSLIVLHWRSFKRRIQIKLPQLFMDSFYFH